ncbi:alternative ribosome rescue aminoacyl-tRNA hydrolase ArfB [Corynebacterium pilosum]|uniref:alternative ribosome rescue aminoacyl-tRNA hydrolase ArfB n=1 Tax=Corynebacterium pilosum TaxID=35756 RepID=UPI0003808B5E|nr:alternative ribosome rescue aminoacyl-tRNA hydrolase ArfB [Corynebacterium pilosum]
MRDVRIAPGPGVPNGLVIPAADLTERFARSSGPGGQSVNTTDSKVQLSFDIEQSSALSEKQKARAIMNLGTTVLTVEAAAQRSQLRNRNDARDRLAAMLREALAPPPPPRKKTKPTQGSVRRRMDAKRRRSKIKKLRKPPRSDSDG